MEPTRPVGAVAYSPSAVTLTGASETEIDSYRLILLPNVFVKVWGYYYYYNQAFIDGRP